jgi:hypothetical protein
MELPDLLAHPHFLGASLMQVCVRCGVMVVLGVVGLKNGPGPHNTHACALTHSIARAGALTLCASGHWSAPRVCDCQGLRGQAALTRCVFDVCV